MNKKALRKDFFIEIKKTYNRFISILLIVALGVAFFAGLRACRSDMEITADTYYDETNLMDLRIVSTLGLTDSDIEGLKKVEGISAVEAGFTKDVILNINDSELAVKTFSLNETINEFYLVEGKIPTNTGECMVDTLFLENTGYKIGDTVKMESGDASAIEDSFKEIELKIVGSCKSSRYLTFARGNTNIGNGEIHSFLVLPKENYKSEVYSEAFVTVTGAKALMTYGSEYENLVEDVTPRIKEISKSLLSARYEEIVTKPKQELEDAKETINAEKTSLQEKKDSVYAKFEEANKQLNTYEIQVTDARNTLEEKKESLREINYGENDIARLFAVQEETVQAKEEEIKKQKKELESQLSSAEQEFTKAEEEINNKEQEIMDAEEKLAAIPEPKWYVLDRNTIESYVSYGSDADRMEAIAEVFPAFFFLVAALVCLTTMTRMVDEQRVQIGTLKALGYSKVSIASKYILYALLATFAGSIVGALIGQKVFPRIVITAYKIMYKNIPYVLCPYQWRYIIMAGVLAVLCTTLAAFFACEKELKANPANLMRPLAPKAGKRIFIERIHFIWKRLNFTKKATLRNLFRYKKRFLMTVIGIAGCMALLLVGFGVKDSIGVMSEIQYAELWKKDGTISLNTDMTKEKKETLLSNLSNLEEIKKAALSYETAVELVNGKYDSSATLITVDTLENFEAFYHFRDRISKEVFHLNDEGVILTEKLAKTLHVSAGDTVMLKVDEFKEVEIKIEAVTENYINHMIYMTPAVYETIYGEEPVYNQCILIETNKSAASEEKLYGQLLNDNEDILSILSTSVLQDRIDDMLKSLNIIVFVLILCAGLLAFIVLYNLSNINITERKRELASLKVLGFYDKEVNSYVMKENMILTFFGIIVGIALGIVLHRFVIVTSEVEMVMFGRLIKGISFIYSSALTFLFTIFISFVMYFKLKKIDMIESLKSVE